MKYKTSLSCALAFLFLTSCFSMSVSAEFVVKDFDVKEDAAVGESGGPNYYALFIALEEFYGIETPGQEWIDESSTAMYERLLLSENWKEENIKLLQNENATKENIKQAITGWLDDKENENDIVLIFWNGHGWKTKLKDRRYGDAYVFTYNISDHYFGDDKISDKELDSWVDELDSKHIVMIQDHCFSGRMFSLRQFGRTILAAGGRFIFCPANWSDYLESSIFTYYILEGLEGVADLNNDGWVTAREIFRYARFPVIWHSTFLHFPFIHLRPGQKIPIKFLGPQIPFMYDRHIGDIPLVKL